MAKRQVRAGMPSFIPAPLLEDFPPEAEIVRFSHRETGPIEVEFLLAPWSQPEVDQVLPRVRGLRVLQSFGAGIEGLLPLIPEGAVLCNAQGLHNAPTAEWALAAILGSLKFLPFYAGLQSRGHWITSQEAETNYTGIYGPREGFGLPVLVEELYGKTVLIVGYGIIGKAIEDRLTPFGVSVLRVARSAREGVSPVGELHALLPLADIVVLITPLTPATRHLIDAAAIARMKRGALLVNAARGGVVETDALLAALNERRIRAALDVTDPEPLPAGHPLWQAPGLLLTPHVGGSSPAYLGRVIGFARAQLTRYLRGEPLQNVIRGDY